MSTTLDTIDDGGVNIVEFSYFFSQRYMCTLGSPQKETSVWAKRLQSGCSHLVVCQRLHPTSSTNQHFRVYRYGKYNITYKIYTYLTYKNINIICIKTQHTQHTARQQKYNLLIVSLVTKKNFCALSSEKWQNKYSLCENDSSPGSSSADELNRRTELRVWALATAQPSLVLPPILCTHKSS